MGFKAKLVIWYLKYRKLLLPAAVLAVALGAYLIWFR